MRIHVPSEPMNVAVLISGQGRGSNMCALIDACNKDNTNANVNVVIGTRADAPAISLARDKGVETVIISPAKYVEDENGYAETLLKALRRRNIRLICLAGYMRQLPLSVVQQYSGRIMNTHPALLPKFGGKGMFGQHVHQAVLDSGDAETGSTVHFVDQEYDTGPIILQRKVAVLPDDTPTTLSARVLKEEHLAYAEAVLLFAQNRIRLESNGVVILPEPTGT